MPPSTESPQRRALPTLNLDGTRQRVRPKLFVGVIYRRRLVVAWGLLTLFLALPWLRVGGLPAVLLDVAQRRFTFFGRTFLATDGVLLMLALLATFVSIIAVTAVWGRAFCGWACPQTVYLEFVFRPIERLFEGDRNAQLRRDRDGGGVRRVAKNLTFGLLSVVVANVFLSYFVGTDTVLAWVTRSPSQHLPGFLVMSVTAVLVFADFAFFREQMCTVACPYARLQSVLLDRESTVVAYDAKRGEPRKKGKPVLGGGDCIDCGACVVACPTGIDIRDGLQIECIACGQCTDACNTIMPKIGKPLHLIRSTSATELEGKKNRTWRPRVVAYTSLVALLLSALFVAARNPGEFDVTVLRGIGAPFALQQGKVRNQLRIKVANRGHDAAQFSIEVQPTDAHFQSNLSVIAAENPLVVAGGASRTTSVFTVSELGDFTDGELPVIVRVSRLAPHVVHASAYKLLGPSAAGERR